jgi:hypothetical protein
MIQQQLNARKSNKAGPKTGVLQQRECASRNITDRGQLARIEPIPIYPNTTQLQTVPAMQAPLDVAHLISQIGLEAISPSKACSAITLYSAQSQKQYRERSHKEVPALDMLFSLVQQQQWQEPLVQPSQGRCQPKSHMALSIPAKVLLVMLPQSAALL